MTQKFLIFICVFKLLFLQKYKEIYSLRFFSPSLPPRPLLTVYLSGNETKNFTNEMKNAMQTFTTSVFLLSLTHTQCGDPGREIYHQLG